MILDNHYYSECALWFGMMYCRVMFGGNTAGRFGAAVEYRTVAVSQV